MTGITNVNPEKKMSTFPNDFPLGMVGVSNGGGGSVGAPISWVPVSGTAVSSATKISIPVSEIAYAATQIGSPIKFVDSSGVPKFGMVIARSTSSITVAGPPMTVGAISEFYGGQIEKVLQVDIHLPGSWDQASTALIADVADKYLRWHSGRAYLVRVAAKAKVADTTSDPEINVTVGGNAVLVSDLAVGSSWSTLNRVDLTNYVVDFNDEIEINRVTAGGSTDSQDLTVSLTFVMDKNDIPFEPADPNPWVQMTIGPITGTWCGLGEGVHALVPTTYSTQTTGTYRHERWKFTVGAQKLQLLATGYSTYGSSRWAFNYTTDDYEAFTTNTDIGIIKDRVFKTGYVQNGVSFTWTRKGSLWLDS